MGVHIAVDDFGAGYSNFAYLTTLPINTIKIDRSLVQGFPSVLQKGAMVRSIITLAHDLGFHTVAEGVETEEEAVALKTLRCREAQGFIFHRPMLPRDIDRLRDVA
jgi:EAL domain-containing protein (putative c-di-GMP-specific phosphodiesterase class I)